ncbi:unnamed protein product [Ectocarpus sp. 12 AP-2014]
MGGGQTSLRDGQDGQLHELHGLRTGRVPPVQTRPRQALPRRDTRWRASTDFSEALGSPPPGPRRDRSAAGATCLSLGQQVGRVWRGVPRCRHSVRARVRFCDSIRRLRGHVHLGCRRLLVVPRRSRPRASSRCRQTPHHSPRGRSVLHGWPALSALSQNSSAPREEERQQGISQKGRRLSRRAQFWSARATVRPRRSGSTRRCPWSRGSEKRQPPIKTRVCQRQALCLETMHIGWGKRQRYWPTSKMDYKGGTMRTSKWKKDHQAEREEAERIFGEEQLEQEQREEEEEAERERLAEESDRACWKCGEVDHRSDGDLIILCDGADCSGASHVGCCDPPLQGVPDGDWFCSECVATGRAPVSNQEDTETLPEFSGVEEEFICDAGDAADMDEEEEEDPTDVVFSGRNQPSSPSISEDTDGQVRKAVKPRKRRGVAHEISELCEPNPTHKHSSLLWRRGKDAASNVLTRLSDQFKTAQTMLAEIKKARTKQDTRSLT